LSSLAAAGIDTNHPFDAIKVDFQDLKTTETSKNRPIRRRFTSPAKTTVTFDAAKMKGRSSRRSWPPTASRRTTPRSMPTIAAMSSS